MSFTTTDLLNTIKTRAMLPDASSGALSPDNLLMLATEEMSSIIVPLILAAREKYYETYVDALAVPNQSKYPIPQRAVGGVLSAVQYIFGINIVPLVPMDPSSITTNLTALSPRGFYFQNNDVVIFPAPSSPSYTIRMRYFQRTSALAQVQNCAQITSIDPIGISVTVAPVPSTWSSTTIVDFIPNKLPYTPYNLDTAVTNVIGSVVYFAALPADLAVGDWLAEAGTTPIPEIPNEFFSVLAQATACKALEALGDKEGLAVAQQNLKQKCDNALKLITPRDQTTPKKVVSNWRNW